MPAVRAEFGPTLPELVGPRLRALPRAARVALLAAAAVLVVGFLAALGARGRTPTTPVVVQEPVAFNLRYPEASLRQATPPRGTSLRLVTRPGRAQETMTVRPLALEPYRGDPTVALSLLIPRMMDRLRATLPEFSFRSEGRTRVNESPGYQLQYQARVDGRLVYGRRVLLVPQTDEDPSPRSGVQLDLLSQRSPAVANVDLVGNNGPLKTPFRSFRFGTERPG